MRNSIRKAAGRASLALSLLVFVGFVLLPHLGLYRTVTVLSNSMEPAFGAGDLIVVAPEPLREVRPGHVLTYAAPVGDHHVVTHRVVELVEPGDRPVVVTKGDANTNADPWQARLEGEVAWRHRATIPYAGHALLFLRNPAVRNALIYLAPALLALIWLHRIWRLPARTLRRIVACAVAVAALLGPASPAGAGWTSAGSAGPQAIGVGSLAAPSSPTSSVTCVPGTSITVGLSWPAAANATGYDVSRSTASGGPYTLIGSSATTSYADATANQQTTYYYVVVAKRSAWTSAASAQSAVATPKQANCK